MMYYRTESQTAHTKQKGDIWNLMLKDGAENRKKEETPQKKRTRGKDKKPRKRTEAADRAQKANLVKARQNSPIVQGIEQANNLPEEYNANAVSFIMAITPTEPLDLNDVGEMERRFENYIRLCSEYGKKVSNQAAYLAIGINKDQARDFANGVSANPERSHFIKKVQQICGVYREQLMSDGKINPVTGIFWQKNYDGLRDQTELAVAPVNPLGDGKSAEELAKKYADDAYIDAEEQKALPDKQKDDTAN